MDALLPLQQQDSDSVVISDGANKPSAASQPVSEIMIASPMVSVDQKINESTSNQKDTGVMASQNIDQANVNSSSQVVDFKEINVDQAVKKDIADQEVNKSQESIDMASVQETSEVASNQETDESVNMHETVNTEELVNTQEAVNTQEVVNTHINTQEAVNTHINTQEVVNTHINTQEVVNVHINTQETINNSTAQAVAPSQNLFSLTNNSQDTMPDDAVDPPHHKTQLDLWQHSFVLTHPSCVNCSSEARSLWHEPVMDKTPTRPLQHYTSSANADQVSNHDDVIHSVML